MAKSTKKKTAKKTPPALKSTAVDESDFDFEADSEQPKVEAKPAPAPVKEKPVKKVEAKPAVSISEIMKGMKSFSAEVMESKDDADFGFPYRIPFNHVGLQMATGGIIGGKMCEINGDSQTGKSFLMYELIANVQAMGGYALLYDYERAYEPAYAKASGINLETGTFAVINEKDMEYFFTNSTKFITNIRDYESKHRVKTPAPILICADSFAGMNTKVDITNAEEGKDPRGYAAMQKNARFSQLLDKFIPFIDDNNATFILINQTRKDHSIEFGDQTVTLGEGVIKFLVYAADSRQAFEEARQKIQSLEYKSGTKETVGSTVIWETIKNRSVKPFQKVILRFFYTKGLEKYSGLDEILYGRGKITQATTTIAADGTKVTKPIKGFKVVGDEKFFYKMADLVESHPELIEPAWTGSAEEDLDVAEDDGKEDGDDE